MHDGDIPALYPDLFVVPASAALGIDLTATHKPRILLLYGSTRERSFSRLVTEAAARLLQKLGAETRMFDPRGLPLPDHAPCDHPKVKELLDLVLW